MAAATMTMVPAFILFTIGQKYGAYGGVKGRRKERL
jgi:ABC-type maltose transport system permease subunit